MKRFIFPLALIILVSACKKKDDPEPVSPNIEALKSEVVNDYARIVHFNYADCKGLAEILSEKIEDFTSAPSAEGLEEAKQAWLDLREFYGQTEAYRFYGGPIDDEDGPEGLLNAWPMAESYIDYVEGDAAAGIINQTTAYPTITKEVLEGLNEVGSETNISVGFHAIEFLLWGQDFNTDGPGNRPYTDYLSSGGTASNQIRRQQYLNSCAELLVEHLEELEEAWSESGLFRASFVADADKSLAKIYQGAAILAKGELAGERMVVALESQEQEDEHSCFSDNTHRDIVTNFIGIKNVCNGYYVRSNGDIINGKGLDDLLSVIDPASNTRLQEQLALCEAEVLAIEAPFDQAILTDQGGHITGAVDKLRFLSDLVVDVARIAGITVINEVD
jgi:putative iron-regulated protein